MRTRQSCFGERVGWPKSGILRSIWTGEANVGRFRVTLPSLDDQQCQIASLWTVSKSDIPSWRRGSAPECLLTFLRQVVLPWQSLLVRLGRTPSSLTSGSYRSPNSKWSCLCLARRRTPLLSSRGWRARSLFVVGEVLSLHIREHCHTGNTGEFGEVICVIGL